MERACDRAEGGAAVKQLTPELVDTVRCALTGARRAKFEASVAVLNASLAQGAWGPRGRVKSKSGFYQGLNGKFDDTCNFVLGMCLRYGNVRNPGVLRREALNLPRIERAWVYLCLEAAEARKELDLARPKPIVTPIGLSPKVAKTLTECNLDLDLASIRMPEIAFFEQPVFNADGTQKIRDSEPVVQRIYYVQWVKGISHHMSRFAVDHDHCEACGKHIPSRLFVPVEARCRRNGWVSLWVGTDCAKNIFGIKDVGLARDQKAPVRGT